MRTEMRWRKKCGKILDRYEKRWQNKFEERVKWEVEKRLGEGPSIDYYQKNHPPEEQQKLVENVMKKRLETTKRDSLKLDKTQKGSLSEELKFENRDPIVLTTQLIMSSNLMVVEKPEVKKTIKKVKFDTNPITYYETGVGVDQVEMPVPSGRGDSSIMTASIKQLKML
ncbi:hypothetical protein CRE_21484 [Caenorhabditis remanei]|uniref:Uncharacterized protein n=1 Tax=Caenorhabditis remanei TaxID=31234 RepID=E3N8Y3_CAERE|nr:hypothetical protein CRE_21484 [Caenorhabditis remanei]